MKDGKLITLEEKRRIQLEMLKEIDAFCRENKIKYSLAFGTLLGAIRHRGFIPWDDDVDIMMPVSEMIRFKQLFHSERMKYLDVDIEGTYEFAFSRICDLSTYKKDSLLKSSYGVCIDLYPLVSIPKEKSEMDLFFRKAQRLQARRLRYMKMNKHVIKWFPIKSIPGFHKAIKSYTDFLLGNYAYGKTGMYYIVAGPLNLRDKMSYDFDLFDNVIDVSFEGSKFCSISRYDEFLKMRYGCYLQLPPEVQRHPYHGGKYYWK